MRLRKTLVIGIAMASLLSGTVSAGGKSPVLSGDDLVLKKVGDKVFWEGVVIESAQVLDDTLCDVVDPCYEYQLTVSGSPPGTRLRIGFTAVLPEVGSVRPWADSLAKSPEMHFEIQLYEPGTGPSTHEPFARKENGLSGGLHGYSAEFDVGGIDTSGSALAAPKAGTWTIRVVPMSVMEMGFRMRATLEDSMAYPSGLQYPDLRLNPPFELNFGTAPGSFQPGVTAEHGGPHASCMAEEIAEAVHSDFPPPQLCLRFSMGLENVGVGLFELVWQRSADEADAAGQVAGTSVKPQLQRVCDFLGDFPGRSDPGCVFEPNRGIKTTFHWGHAHEHWVDAWSIRLLKVTEDIRTLHGRTPSMREVGEDRKLGIAPAAELIADWGRFWLGSRARVGVNTGCFDMDRGGHCSGFFPITLRAGWADLYEWNRGGNYVDFPQGLPLTPEPGVYLLQGEIDPRNLIAESNEANNLSYAFFEVRSDGHVRLLERGYGSSPWDNKKTVSTVSP